MKKQFKQDVKKSWSFFLLKISFLFSIGFVFSCSEKKFQPGSDLENQAIIDQVNLYVNKGECSKAIALIEPLYASTYTNDDVRVARASAHACQAGLTSYFDFLNEVIENPICNGNNCNSLWVTPTKYFTLSGLLSSSMISLLTKRKEAGLNALDALQAILNEGTVVPTQYQINSGTSNIGSLRVTDRTDEANIFIFSTSMAILGAIQNLYGQTSAAPFTSTYFKRTSLPWTDYATMDEEGCEYGSAVLNLFDSMDELGDSLDVGLSTNIISNLDTACTAYCTLTCGFTAEECGTSCSIYLRNRDTCMAQPIAQCHAAAIVEFINTDASYGWPCEDGVCL